MKKIIFLIFIIFLGTWFFSQQVFAKPEENSILEIQFFYSKTCPHCIAEQKFLDGIEKKYPQIKINQYIFNTPENLELLKELLKEHNAEKYLGHVPLTFIGNTLFVGFDSSETTGKEIEELIQEQLKGSEQPPGPIQKKINIPIIGELDISKYSLPVLTVILGILDGFNICSLGAIVLILGLVLALKSRKRVLIFGGIFLLTTAIVYGALIVLWHQLFSILTKYEKVMEILVGILGIGGGIYFLKEFIRIKKQGPTCQTSDHKLISKFSTRVRNHINGHIKESKGVLAVAISILLFAAIITIVEFPCSAAVPVIYAGILANANLPGILYILYIAFYLIFYLLDEILVFLIAVFTMKLWLTSPKFVTWITLIEAIVLFLLGLYYLIGL